MRVDRNQRKTELIGILKLASKLCTDDGSIHSLAKVLNVSRQRLYQCADDGEVSPRLARKIEVITDGKVSREILNPTIFG